MSIRDPKREKEGEKKIEKRKRERERHAITHGELVRISSLYSARVRSFGNVALGVNLANFDRVRHRPAGE